MWNEIRVCIVYFLQAYIRSFSGAFSSNIMFPRRMHFFLIYFNEKVVFFLNNLSPRGNSVFFKEFKSPGKAK